MSRQKSKESKLRTDIVKFLKEKNLFEKTDLSLIDELEYQYFLLNEAKKDIALRGIQVNVREFGEPFYNTNQSVGIVYKCTRTIQSIYRQLSITPQDRLKIKTPDATQYADLQDELEEE